VVLRPSIHLFSFAIVFFVSLDLLATATTTYTAAITFPSAATITTTAADIINNN